MKGKRVLRRDMAVVALLGLMVFSVCVQASPRLRCQVTLNGETRDLEFAPTKDPYNVEGIDIRKSFRFKVVVIGDEHQIDYIKLYTYYQSKRQAVLLHEAKYLAPAAELAPSPAALTGVNYLYSPVLGRELQYGCALFEVAP